jgi:CRISPR-associated protein Cmr1
MPETLEATYRIVTPMFIGGADQTPADGIRPPSFKGALRFWWRALNWTRFRAIAPSDERGLVLLHGAEARLFGSAAKAEQASGQSLFLLRVTRQPGTGREAGWPENNTGSGYLGYGLMATNEAAHRIGIREGADFDVQLRFKPGATQDDAASVQEALQALGLFGGLGSRARRGFGSLTLVQLNGEDALLDATGFEQAAGGVLDSAQAVEAFPPYTAFTRQARFGVLATGSDPRRVHSQAGNQYRTHRGQASTLRGNDKIPFGLPLQGIDADSRRASPLLFHVQALRQQQYAAAVLYLPARFHHDKRYQPSDLAQFNREVARFIPAGGAHD